MEGYPDRISRGTSSRADRVRVGTVFPLLSGRDYQQLHRSDQVGLIGLCQLRLEDLHALDVECLGIKLETAELEVGWSAIDVDSRAILRVVVLWVQ